MFNLKIIVTVIFILFVSHYAFSQNKVDVSYCEDISDKLGHYSDKEELYEDLKLKALGNAVKQLLSEEIENIKTSLPNIDIESVIYASKDFIKYDKMEIGAEAGLKPCIVLKGCYVSQEDRARYNKIQIAKISTDNFGLFKELVKKTRDFFISSLRMKKTKLSLMMNDEKHLQSKTDKELSKLIHEKTIKSDSNSALATESKAFYVYPIQIYAASSVKKVSPVITVESPVSTKDDQGKTAEFQLVVIHRDYNWKFASSKIVEKFGYKKTKPFNKKFDNDEFKGIVKNNFIEIICVGMASCEGDKKDEYERAKRRSLTLIRWLKDALSENQDICISGIALSNHNKYSKDDCRKLSAQERAFQRRIVLIGVTKNSTKGKSIKEALIRGIEKLEQNGTLPIRHTDYSNFEFVEREARCMTP